MMIKFFIFFLLAISKLKATNYKEVTNDNGIIVTKLGIVRIRAGYSRFIHKIDLKIIEKNLDYVETTANSIKPVEHHLGRTLKYKLQHARNQLSGLKPIRQKRGLIDALGTAIKFIAGNPDSEDLRNIQENLVSIEQKENGLITNSNRQYKVNSIFEEKLNNITKTLHKVTQSILQSSNTPSDLQVISIIFEVDEINQILRIIGEQIEFAKLNVIHKDLFTLEEKEKFYSFLKNQMVSINQLDEVFKYCSGNIAFSNNQAVILIKLPMLEKETFELLELHTLNRNESKIDTHIRYVAKNGNRIFRQNKICEICEPTWPIEDQCIFNILVHKTPICPIRTTFQKWSAKEILPGIILLDTQKPITVYDSCGIAKNISIPTIIEAENCTIKLKNLTFNSRPIITHNEYLIPTYGKFPKKTEDFEEDVVLVKINNLEKLAEEHFYKNQKHTTITTTSVILLIAAILAYSCTRYWKNRKNSHQLDRDAPILRGGKLCEPSERNDST